MATVVGGIIGGVIGGTSAGPWGWAAAWRGFQVGASIGMLVDSLNVPSVESGRLSDLRLTGSQEGAPIPVVFGKFRVGGNLIDAVRDANGDHLVRHRRRSSRGGSSGIGGASQTTNWYSATPLFGLAKGVVCYPDETFFTFTSPSIKRIWAGDGIVYDSAAATNKVTPVFLAGTESQAPISALVAASGVASGRNPAYRGTLGFAVEDWDLSDFANRLPNVSAEIDTGTFSLASLLTVKFRQAGLAATDFDVTAVASITVRGYFDGRRSSPQSDIDALLLAYNCILVDVDGKLIVLQRGGSVVVTIPEAHLGDAETPVAEFKSAMLEELPGRVDVVFYDVDADYEQATASAVRQTADTRNARTVQLPLAMTGTEGRAAAQQVLDNLWLERDAISFLALPQYMYLAPGDVIEVALANGTVRARIATMSMTSFGHIRFSAVQDLAQALLAAPVGGTGSGATTPPAIVPSEFLAWSGTELVDEHQGSPGFYVVAAGDTGWRGCTIMYSLDAGTSWITGQSIATEGIFGEATSVLSATGAVANTWDGANTVDVDLAVSAGVLEAQTQSQVEGGANYAVLGDEILGFTTPTLTAPFEYTLSDLRRGGRLTSMSGHAIAERFVVITEDIARVVVPESAIGSAVLVKCLSPGEVLADVTAQSVTIAVPTPLPVEAVKALAQYPVFSAASLASGTAEVTSWTPVDPGLVDQAKSLLVFARIKNNGSMVTKVRVRTASGQPEFEILRVKADSDIDENGSQCIIPLSSSGTFEYVVEGADVTDWLIDQVGYWRTIE